MSLTKVALDFCLSVRLVGMLQQLYGHHGYQFLHLDAFAKKNDPDQDWADKYKQFGGKLVLSGDCKIAYKPHEAVAFIDNGLVTIFPSENFCNLKLNAHGAVFAFYWPLIAEKFSTASDGTCWRLPLVVKERNAHLMPIEIQPLEIPLKVLQRAREVRNANRIIYANRA